MGAHKSELNELDLEKLKTQLLIQEIRRIASDFEEILHFNKYYERPLCPDELTKIHRKILQAAIDFA